VDVHCGLLRLAETNGMLRPALGEKYLARATKVPRLRVRPSTAQAETDAAPVGPAQFAPVDSAWRTALPDGSQIF